MTDNLIYPPNITFTHPTSPKKLSGTEDVCPVAGNNDGKVTLGEVKAYLDREMTYQARRRFSRDQHATVSGDLKTILSAY